MNAGENSLLSAVTFQDSNQLYSVAWPGVHVCPKHGKKGILGGGKENGLKHSGATTVCYQETLKKEKSSEWDVCVVLVGCQSQSVRFNQIKPDF